MDSLSAGIDGGETGSKEVFGEKKTSSPEEVSSDAWPTIEVKVESGVDGDEDPGVTLTFELDASQAPDASIMKHVEKMHPMEIK
jgi:hypothetical protein